MFAGQDVIPDRIRPVVEERAKDFGATLRQHREGRGVSLKQIAAATKISVGSLEALERNQIARLPGGIFTRAFVRSYAAHVGLDPDRTIQDFLTSFPDVQPPETASSIDRESGVSNGWNRWRVLLGAAILLGLIVVLRFGLHVVQR